ncbi:cytochrome C oxidase subunit II [Lederbergia citri]|uniref:Cytochrome C oxidase subunit II n=1 Tax=Lederbergia citri TaxID=2833580 RepID=A0A942YIN7_9BACI|nr:cytochrome C oxidase subunit II [Lederbergia citri]MBS4197164.1 cytochrome C oxidase subunit II [Lederbergia citri]
MAKKKHHSDVNLKGTLISVFTVGIIILVMWFAVYGLYVAR